MSLRRLVWGLPVLLGVALVAVAGARAPAAKHGIATRVVDGDTFLVRVAPSRQLRVRLAGVSTPAGSDCGAAAATQRLRALVLKKSVTLTSAGAGRWYASVRGSDVGRALIADGIVQVDVWGSSFARFPDYAQTEQLAQSRTTGIWKSCSADVAATVQPSKELFPSHSTASFAVTVSNGGALAAPGVTLDLRPPTGSSFASVQPTSGTCAIEGYHAACALGTIAPNASLKVDAVVTTGGSGTIATRAFVKFGWCVRSPCGTTPVSDSNRQNDVSGGFAAVGDAGQPLPVLCDPSYPTVCIPPPPPRLECNDIPFKNFQVRHDTPSADPQHLDNNLDNVGCTFDDY